MCTRAEWLELRVVEHSALRRVAPRAAAQPAGLRSQCMIHGPLKLPMDHGVAAARSMFRRRTDRLPTPPNIPPSILYPPSSLRFAARFIKILKFPNKKRETWLRFQFPSLYTKNVHRSLSRPPSHSIASATIRNPQFNTPLYSADTQ